LVEGNTAGILLDNVSVLDGTLGLIIRKVHRYDPSYERWFNNSASASAGNTEMEISSFIKCKCNILL